MLVAVPEFFSTYDGVTNAVTELECSGKEEDVNKYMLGLHRGRVFLCHTPNPSPVCLCAEFHTRMESKYLATAVLVSPSPGLVFSFVGCKYGNFGVWRNCLEVDLTRFAKPRAFLAACALVPHLSSSDRAVFRLAFGVGLNHFKIFQLVCDLSGALEFVKIGLVRGSKSHTSAGFDETASHLVTLTAGGGSATLDPQLARMYLVTGELDDDDAGELAMTHQLIVSPAKSKQEVEVELGGWMGNQSLAKQLLQRDCAMRNTKLWNDTIPLYRDLFPGWLEEEGGGGGSGESIKRIKRDPGKEAEEIFELVRQHYLDQAQVFVYEYDLLQAAQEAELGAKLKHEHSQLQHEWEEIRQHQSTNSVDQLNDQAKLAAIDELQKLVLDIQQTFQG
ncbi:hypothetical protein BASA81_006651 [Batrachochytrium salamandrivorans]|nr:hypothetical protein BASA81_006651 [Batrachochytrium salamandrivorans]